MLVTGQSESAKSSAHMGRMTREPEESLKETAKRWRGALRDARTGMTRVAVEVAKLVDVWDERWKAEANGLTLGQWLRAEVDSTLPLSTYLLLAKGAGMAKARAYRMDTRALLWLVKAAPSDDAFMKSTAIISEKYSDNRSRPLSLTQVKEACKKLVPVVAPTHESRANLTARIERLEEQIRKLGAEPVE